MEDKLICFAGTRGIPPRYGGFETAVDEISKRFSESGYKVEIVCRRLHSRMEDRWGRNVFVVEGSQNRKLDTFVSSIQTGIYLLKNRSRYQHVFWFNNANFPGILLTLLAGIPCTVNTDGLEWRRKKWGFLFKAYYYLASAIISRVCPGIISDSRVIQEYYKTKFHRETWFVPYGVPEPLIVDDSKQGKILEKYQVERGKFLLQITRIEPDNLPLELAKGFIKSGIHEIGMKFLIIGFKDKTEYSLSLKKLSGSSGVYVCDAEYDPEILYTLRVNSFSYVHGNSVGGTNPALLEAMASCPRIMAVNNPFSRELLGELGVYYFPENVDLSFRYILSTPENRKDLKKRVQSNYQWEAVSKAYMAIALGDVPNYSAFLKS